MTITEDPCNGLGSFHCWHATGLHAPATAPGHWAEFKCCNCGKVRTAENFIFANGPHGPHAPPAGVLEQGYSIW